MGSGKKGLVEDTSDAANKSKNELNSRYNSLISKNREAGEFIHSLPYYPTIKNPQ